MSFGFDPSIILANTPKAPAESSLNETLQTLAQLQTSRTQNQTNQASLADLLQQRQQRDSLASIYKANADTPDALPVALRRGGFGTQADSAQDQASQMQTADVTRGKLLREIQDAQRKKVGDLFYGTKDAKDYAARVQSLASDPDPHISMYAQMLPKEYDPGVVERLGALSMSAKDRAELADKKASQAETGRHNLATESKLGETERHDRAMEARAAAGSPLATTRKDALVAKLSENMTRALDEGQWKGPIAAQVTSRNQADHLLALTENAKTGGFNNLDSREQEELALGFAKLLSGGQGTEAQVKTLVPPHTLQSGAQGLKEWLLNEPQGRNQVAFVERLAHSVERQRGVAEGLIAKEKAKRAGSYRKLQELDPDQHQAVLMGTGLDPSAFDDKGVYQAAGAAKGGGGLSKAEQDELKQLEARFGGAK